MKYVIRSTHLVGTLLAVALTLVSATAAAQKSVCKGLENNVCNSNTACSWVGAYERKDGRKVNGFCRNKAKTKSAKVSTKTVPSAR